MASKKRRDEAIEGVTQRFSDGAARICRLYGVSPLLGRLFAALFFSAEPLTLEELANRGDAAKSSVSVALRQLLRARVIRRVDIQGDRRDWYEAVDDPWSVLSDWIRLFFQPELEMWGDVSADAMRTFADAAPGSERGVLLARVGAWRELIDVFEAFIADVPRRPPKKVPERAKVVKIDIEGAP